MLKPYVCVACEKIILTKENVASLINLFSKIIVAVPANSPDIPRNAVAPKEWAIFSSWDTELGDELKDYEFCTQIFYPDGTPFGEPGKVRIPIDPGKRAQVTVQIPAFPIGQTGLYTVKTWIEEGQTKVFGPLGFGIELAVIQQDRA
jgi:hypothetical protein